VRRALLAIVLLAAGCRTTATAPEGVEPRQMYQTVANVLPEADLGWGTPPSVIHMTARSRAEGPAPEPEPLSANERGFKVFVEVFDPRTVTIPYAAIQQVFYEWSAIPNALLLPFLVLPLQGARATVVFDARQVHGFLDGVERECERLEAVTRATGLGGAYGHAQGVREKLKDDAREFGDGMVSLHFDSLNPVPAVIPYAGRARTIAEAFAWCAAHPEEGPR
jgi:hypothetical protein